MSRGPRGFTLLEMMIVVAIVGILSALAVVSIVSMGRIGRVNAAAGALTRALVDARLRAMTQRCPHVAQINGPTYAPVGPPVGLPKTPGTVSVIRKARCEATGADLHYQPGLSAEGFDRDRVLTVSFLGDEAIATRGVRFFVTAPAGLVSAGELTSQSMAVAYDIAGARSVLVDIGDGTGFAVPTGADVNLVITSPVDSPDGGAGVQVSVPVSGVASRF